MRGRVPRSALRSTLVEHARATAHGAPRTLADPLLTRNFQQAVATPQERRCGLPILHSGMTEWPESDGWTATTGRAYSCATVNREVRR